MGEPLPGALQELVKRVSRSFYLTMRVLPGAIRPQISLAYLLARAGDTIADTSALEAAHRRDALQTLRAAIAESAQGREAKFHPAVSGGSGTAPDAEHLLLRSLDAVFTAMRVLPESDRLLIAGVLDTITREQERDLIRFAAATPEQVVALESDEHLDRYTYSVAGCVGEFWTHVCRNHLFRGSVFRDPAVLPAAVQFGKGLQLVNILRDIAADLRQGRCYIPRLRLAEFGLVPGRLRDPRTMECFRPLYREYLGLARGCLAAGWRYTGMIPFAHVRVRLACAWPVLIGVRTLDRLESANVLDPRNLVKITRGEVRRLIASSLLRYPSPSAWHRLFENRGGTPH